MGGGRRNFGLFSLGWGISLGYGGYMSELEAT